MEFTRQAGLVNREVLASPLCLVGAGAIGSFTALILAKMGYQGPMEIWDDDLVEAHNLPNQFYPQESIGQDKVAVLRQMIAQFTGKEVQPVIGKCQDPTAGHEVLVLAVDSMDERIRLYQSAKTRGYRWVFDGRMGGETMRLYTAHLEKPSDVELYESMLYPSSEATPIPCTERTVIYNVAVVAGLLANQIKRALMHQAYKREIIFNLASLTLMTR